MKELPTKFRSRKQEDVSFVGWEFANLHVLSSKELRILLTVTCALLTTILNISLSWDLRFGDKTPSLNRNKRGNVLIT